MLRLLCALAFLLPFLAFAGRLSTSGLQPPTATPGPTEVIATATRPPTISIPTPKPPRPSYTPTRTPTRTPSPTRTATRTLTPTPTPGPIYELRPGDNWLEAEWPTSPEIGAWQIRDDGAASGGQYLVATTDDAGVLEYRFSLDYAGTIYIWLRAIRAPATEKPIRIRLDSRGDDPASVGSTAWAWVLDDDARYDIQPGVHVFRIEALAAGVKLDQIFITTNRATVP